MADVTLTYKGNAIVELNTTGNKTIKTAGKYCEDDISITYTGGRCPRAEQTSVDSSSEICYIKGNGNAGDSGYGYAYATRTYGIALFRCI